MVRPCCIKPGRCDGGKRNYWFIADAAAARSILVHAELCPSPGARVRLPPNFFDATQQALLRALQRPEFNIRGIRRADLVPFLRQISPASITRQLWRLRQFGLIKKVVHGYRYYLTRLGRSTIAAACRITEQSIVPALAHATP
jgi:hypothetical protein